MDLNKIFELLGILLKPSDTMCTWKTLNPPQHPNPRHSSSDSDSDHSSDSSSSDSSSRHLPPLSLDPIFLEDVGFLCSRRFRVRVVGFRVMSCGAWGQ